MDINVAQNLFSQRWNLNFEGVHHRMNKVSQNDHKPMEFSEHFDSSLTYDSLYHRNLKNLMDCVERNKHACSSPEQEFQACGKEFNELRVQAIDGQLLLNNVQALAFRKENAALKRFTTM